MPKSKRKSAAKTARTVRTVRPVAKKSVMAMDNKLVIAALVLLLAVAVFMLVEAWTGIR